MIKRLLAPKHYFFLHTVLSERLNVLSHPIYEKATLKKEERKTIKTTFLWFHY